MSFPNIGDKRGSLPDHDNPLWVSSPKSSRGALGTRSVTTSDQIMPDLDIEIEGFSPAGNLSARQTHAVNPAVEVPGAIAVSEHELNQFYSHLVTFNAFLNGAVPTCLVQKAMIPGKEQGVAATLVNYLDYINDCRQGKREPSKQ